MLKMFLSWLKTLACASDNTTVDNDGKQLLLICRQILVASGPLIMIMGLGAMMGYSAVLLPKLERADSKILAVTNEHISWIASIAALPLAMGSLMGGYLMDKIGRKWAFVFSFFPSTFGWALIYFATNIEMILTGRFLTGLGVGIISPIANVYTAETSHPKLRSFLSGSITLSLSMGILLCHGFAIYQPWQTNALLCGLFSTIGAIFTCFSTESPIYLIKKGRMETAAETFTWLRGRCEKTDREFAVILEKNSNRGDDKTLKESLSALKKPTFYQPLLILLAFSTITQFSGINSVNFYTVQIIRKTLGKYFNEYKALLIVDSVRAVGSVASCILMFKLSRRRLAMTSAGGVFISLLVLSTSSYFSTIYSETFLHTLVSVTALACYIFFAAIGLIPLPWCMLGELLTVNTKALAGAIVSCLNFLSFFAVVKVGPDMFLHLGSDGTFLAYAATSLLGIIFIYFFLPETKDKTLSDIENIYSKDVCDVES